MLENSNITANKHCQFFLKWQAHFAHFQENALRTLIRIAIVCRPFLKIKMVFHDRSLGQLPMRSFLKATITLSLQKSAFCVLPVWFYGLLQRCALKGQGLIKLVILCFSKSILKWDWHWFYCVWWWRREPPPRQFGVFIHTKVPAVLPTIAFALTIPKP